PSIFDTSKEVSYTHSGVCARRPRAILITSSSNALNAQYLNSVANLSTCAGAEAARVPPLRHCCGHPQGPRRRGPEVTHVPPFRVPRGGRRASGRSRALGSGSSRSTALFIGYCIYFDRKRRSDPNFKNRLRERRKKQKLAKERAGLSKLPDLKDAEAVQKFFLEEIQLGEELLAQGEYEKGVDHLTNAIAVCGQPQQLLQVLQQTLPPPVFQMLLTKLPTISQRIVSAQSLAEDDVE
uniref:Mitochondrial import receptor subunit TOM20 homolog n=1 Tax=Capra hircus TaxID=9925 RepID=A0A8C2SLP6_CAPHI